MNDNGSKRQLEEELDDDFGQHAYELAVESRETSSLYFILFSTLLCGVMVLSKVLHEAPALNKFISEAAMFLLVGSIIGFITNVLLQLDSHEASYYKAEEDDDDIAFQRLISFSPNIFFMALLPPIIFNSGFKLKRELFLRHIFPIVMFAVIGTTISSFVCAMSLFGLQKLNLFGTFRMNLLELFTFGSLIAATDTVSVIAVLESKRVDPHLFYVVFGESALNDAVALVLFNTFADLLRTHKDPDYQSIIAFVPEMLIGAIGSPLLGLFFGLAFALIFKWVDLREKKYRMLELSLFLILMYIPFIIGEALHLSGIVTIFFAGVSVRRYTVPNVSKFTESSGSTVFQLCAFLAETCIFLELGLSVFGFSGSFHWSFCFWALVACLVARAAAIYPLSWIHNWSVDRQNEITSSRNKGDLEEAGTAEASLSQTASGSDDTTLPDDESIYACPSHNSYNLMQENQKRKQASKVKGEKISLKMAHMLWFAGLRGAVAYACARQFPDVNGNNDEITAATMFIVIFTIVIMGGMTESMLEWLNIDIGVDLDKYMELYQKLLELTGPIHRFERKYLYNQVTPQSRRGQPVQQNPHTTADDPQVFLSVDPMAFRSMNSEAGAEQVTS